MARFCSPMRNVHQAVLYRCIAYVLFVILLVPKFIEVTSNAILSPFEYSIVKPSNIQLVEEGF